MSVVDAATFEALSEGYAAASRAAAPATPEDSERLLRIVHDVDRAIDELHGQCFAKPDRHGRCVDCGRLISWPSQRLHKRGGCLMAIPFVGTALWLADNYMSLPVVGRALWHLRRRGGA